MCSVQVTEVAVDQINSLEATSHSHPESSHTILKQCVINIVLIHTKTLMRTVQFLYKCFLALGTTLETDVPKITSVDSS